MKPLINTISKDWIYFLSVLLVSFLSVYFSAPLLNRVIFGLLLVLYWFSKKDYIWFALFFIWIEQPMEIFSGSTMDDFQRIPLYTILPGFSLAFTDFFLIVSLTKAIIKGKNRRRYFFSRELTFILWYGIVLVIFSFVAGMATEYYTILLRAIFAFSFLITFRKLTNTTDEIERFFKLIFPFALVVLIGQIFQLYFGISVGSFLKGVSSVLYSREMEYAASWETVERPINAPFLIYLTFVGGMFYSIIKTKSFKSGYLYAIIASSFLVIFLTASRSWVIVFTILFLLFLLVKKTKLGTLITSVSLASVLFVILMNYVPVFKVQVSNSLLRLSSLTTLFEQGDVKEARFSKYTPETLKVFVKSPIIGFGFTEIGYKNKNGHVGIPTMLVEGGVIELFLFLILWYKLILFPLWVNRWLPVTSQYKGSLAIFAAGIVGTLILNNTTQMYGYDIIGDTLNKTIFLVFLIGITNQYCHTLIEKKYSFSGEILSS